MKISTTFVHRLVITALLSTSFATSVALGQINVTPSDPTVDGREFFVFAKDADSPNIVVNVNGILATDDATQKAAKIFTAFSTAGLKPKRFGNRVHVPGMKFMRWTSYTGENRDSVRVTGPFVHATFLDGDVLAMNDEGQPARYRIGFHGPGFSAECEISALDLPPQIDSAGVMQMLHQQLMQQLPHELQRQVFFDPNERVIIFDGFGLQPQPLVRQEFEIVWGTDDIGLQPTGETQIFGKRAENPAVEPNGLLNAAGEAPEAWMD